MQANDEGTCRGNVPEGTVAEKTPVTVVATHGSLPLECTAPGYALPDGRIFVTDNFSYGNEATDRDEGDQQIDMLLIRFADGGEVFFL